MAGGKSKKKKWSKGKVRDQVANKVLFDEDTHARLLAEVPKMKLITPSALVERPKIGAQPSRGRARAPPEQRASLVSSAPRARFSRGTWPPSRRRGRRAGATTAALRPGVAPTGARRKMPARVAATRRRARSGVERRRARGDGDARHPASTPASYARSEPADIAAAGAVATASSRRRPRLRATVRLDTFQVITQQFVSVGHLGQRREQ